MKLSLLLVKISIPHKECSFILLQMVEKDEQKKDEKKEEDLSSFSLELSNFQGYLFQFCQHH